MDLIQDPRPAFVFFNANAALLPWRVCIDDTLPSMQLICDVLLPPPPRVSQHRSRAERRLGEPRHLDLDRKQPASKLSGGTFDPLYLVVDHS